MVSAIKTLSLFSGCGGLDLGIEGGFPVNVKSINPKAKQNSEGWVTLPKNPFSVIWANDIMKSAQDVWKANFKEGQYELQDIEHLLEQSYALPSADLVVGGFPCQDFSVAGKRQGFSTIRGSLYQSMAKVLQKVQPKAFIAENVFGLLSVEGAVETIMAEFEAQGYQVELCPLFAPDYGIPQARQRLFFIGFRKDALKKPVPKHWIEPEKTHANNPVILKDILQDLPEPDATNDVEHQHYSKAKWYGKGRQGNIEVNLDKPGPTIRAEHHGNIEFRRLSQEHGGGYHHELKAGLKERRLTVRECARIQTFPDNFKFLKTADNGNLVSASAAYKVIGNAVPPLLAYRVAERLASIWDDIYVD
jgi:DNA (cytosine-5)-methyltransferase 1